MVVERRASTRFKMNIHAKMYNAGQEQLLDVVKITNMSAGGIGMETTKFIKPKTGFVVKFLINAESTTPIPAKSIWSEDEHGECRGGAQFTFPK
ncbi:MAG: PilZ domain-containing protein [bacterium]